MKNIIIEMIEWVLANEVNEEPYIAWVSVEQMIWGKGMHWKEDDCPKKLQVGLQKHLKIYRASKLDRKRWKLRTGWEVPDFPPDLYNTIKGVVKECIINEIIRDEKYGAVAPFWAQGYIDPNTEPPTFNPRYAHDIVGWFFYLDEPDAYEFIVAWLNSLKKKNKAIKYQFVYNKKQYAKMIRQQIAAATAKLDLLEDMQRFEGHKQINPKIDPDNITWIENDDED